ncbi:MAG: hypothetical protein JO154_12645 [Chitinophaga sp.]|uniref:hypothetical protein n=1 Tax=Chitinophaga sp. TaxID=1869181 RepID=UPI0025C1E8A3|nr:hypothetical protein [Chitinophaga sp.]MBV8253448.1 hypothetical protein [Chitinophaga sp.]
MYIFRMVVLMTGIPLGLAVIFISTKELEGLIATAILAEVVIPSYILGALILAFLRKKEIAQAMGWSVGILLLIGFSFLGLLGIM